MYAACTALALGFVGACYAAKAPLGAPCASTTSCPVGQTCIAGFCEDHGPLVDAPSAHDAPVPPDVMPRSFASCRDIHASDPALPTGTFTIDPDGPGGDAPLAVTCDMTTAGGGWTIVFLPSSIDEATIPIAYTSSTPRLLADANEVLLAYRDHTQAAAPNSAVFALPPTWQSDTPFDADGDDLGTMASIDGAAPVSATLRYGSQDFSTLCSDDWVSTSSYGRICLEGTTGPFYSAFDTDTADRCADSDQAFNAQVCSTDRVFSIAVR